MLFLLITTTVYGASYTVDASGGGDYTTIQAAVNGAADGDAIDVVAGTYAEAIDLGGKNLDISSVSGSSSTFIQPPVGQVGVTWDQGEAGSLEGFTITSDGPSGCQPVVTGCVDGDGMTIDGRGCFSDPRIGDGHSAAFTFSAIRGETLGISGGTGGPMPGM